jgi:hypothetical protein
MLILFVSSDLILSKTDLCGKGGITVLGYNLDKLSLKK